MLWRLTNRRIIIIIIIIIIKTRHYTNITLHEHGRLGEVSDKSETSPRQVGGTPWISPTPPPCDVGVLQDG